jgi:hypothetical protein
MQQPNFNTVASALTDLQTEIPLIANIGPVQLGQQLAAINHQLGTISRHLHRIRIEQRRIRVGQRRIRIQQRDLIVQGQNILHRVSSLETRARNTEIRTRNNPSVIQPLLNVRTGAIIPNCPRTTEEILTLSTVRADAIILALQIQLNQGATLARKRAAIQLALLA